MIATVVLLVPGAMFKTFTTTIFLLTERWRNKPNAIHAVPFTRYCEFAIVAALRQPTITITRRSHKIAGGKDEAFVSAALERARVHWCIAATLRHSLAAISCDYWLLRRWFELNLGRQFFSVTMEMETAILLNSYV